MGRPILFLYGNEDVGSAIKDIESIIEKIKTNKFDKEDLLTLHNANTELIKALLSNNEDKN